MVSAIVLAAGTASRMGTQKQLLRLGEKILLEHTLDNLRGSRVREIVVVLGSGAEAVRPLIGAGIKIVLNERFAEGMGTSLQCGIAALDAQANGALVVLADQPLVKAATIDRLIADYELHQPQILIPLFRGFRGNPVLLDRSVFPEIAGLKGDMGCRAIFGDHLENIRKLEVEDAGVLLDADRPRDLETLREVFRHGHFAAPVFESADVSLPDAPDVVVVGREGVALAVVKLLRLLGFRATVVDPLLTFSEMPEATAILRAMDFRQLPVAARRFCVVASMGRFDEEAIEQALWVGIPYVALVANQRRAQEVLQGLVLRGVAAEGTAVRTKPGISIGAQTPQEIGLSIVAEIVRELRSPLP